MTVWGWDTSHYDGRISAAAARLAYRQGIRFATAKIGEGGTYDDPLDGPNLAALRDAGVPILGGYYVPRTPGASIAEQVAYCIELADRDMPWWRKWTNIAAGTRWFWQTDLELWGYDQVEVATGVALGRGLAAATGCRVAMYASHGQYGDKLRVWTAADGLLWNANYPTSRRAGFVDLYPGDRYAGWSPYSGRDDGPDLCQFASSATIGGLTTCDANAYRGTLDELRDLLTPQGANDMSAGIDKTDVNTLLKTAAYPYDKPAVSLGTTWLATKTNTDAALAKLDQLIATEAGQSKALDAMRDILTTVLAGGGSTDAAPILARLDAMAAAESTALAAALAEIRDLRHDLAAAEAAAAAALADGPPGA